LRPGGGMASVTCCASRLDAEAWLIEISRAVSVRRSGPGFGRRGTSCLRAGGSIPRRPIRAGQSAPANPRRPSYLFQGSVSGSRGRGMIASSMRRDGVGVRTRAVSRRPRLQGCANRVALSRPPRGAERCRDQMSRERAGPSTIDVAGRRAAAGMRCGGCGGSHSSRISMGWSVG
jgi:hypothetical protein